MNFNRLFTTIFFAIALCFHSCINSYTHSANTTISAKEYFKKLSETKDGFILDVRTPEEFETGHLKNASNINFYDENFKEQISKLDKQKTIFVYCKGGGRSAQAATQLTNLGFNYVFDLEGGIMAWDNENLPIVTTSTVNVSDKFTIQDYDKLIDENKFLLIDFYAKWCIPCKKMEPSLAKISKEYEGKLMVKRIDVDEAATLCNAQKIQGIPIIIVYKNGKQIAKTVGFKSENEIRNLIE